MIKNDFQDSNFSLGELISRLKLWASYLKLQLWKILIFSILCAFLGFIYAINQPINYVAKTTFVVDDPQSNGGIGGLATIAGQFGFDFGSNAGGGLISGENIILYFKSENLIRKVLTTSWDSNNSFADIYLEISELNKKNTLIRIPVFNNSISYSRKEDSIIQVLVHKIIETELSISKVDKKAGFIELTATMRNEVFSKRFLDKLIETAVDEYVQIKTRRQQKTVDQLQNRVDSIYFLLTKKTNASSDISTKTSVMDINPLYNTSNITQTELTLRDKTMLGSIYVEVVKNLELAKFTLTQETPMIQIINRPIYPLMEKKVSKFKSILIAFILSVITSFFYLYIKFFFIKNR